MADIICKNCSVKDCECVPYSTECDDKRNEELNKDDKEKQSFNQLPYGILPCIVV